MLEDVEGVGEAVDLSLGCLHARVVLLNELKFLLVGQLVLEVLHDLVDAQSQSLDVAQEGLSVRVLGG